MAKTVVCALVGSWLDYVSAVIHGILAKKLIKLYVHWLVPGLIMSVQFSMAHRHRISPSCNSYRTVSAGSLYELTIVPKLHQCSRSFIGCKLNTISMSKLRECAGVMVNTLAREARGSGFNPRPEQNLYSVPAHATWVHSAHYPSGDKYQSPAEKVTAGCGRVSVLSLWLTSYLVIQCNRYSYKRKWTQFDVDKFG